MDFDEDDLNAAGLTESERAALNEPDEDREALEAIAGEGDDEHQADEHAAGEGGKPAANANQENTAADGLDDEDDDAPSVAFRAEAPADAADKLSALEARDAEAFAKLMDGEINPEDYQKVRAEVTRERDDIQAQVLKASISADMAEQQAANAWDRACKRFIASAKNDEGIDYTGNRLLGNALDQAVKELAADPANADKPASYFLSEAHKQVKQAFGHKPAAAPAAAPAPAAAAPAARKPDLSQVPPSLAKLPPAQEPIVGDDEFAHLRGLTGNDYELAIARMSSEQLNRFMAS